MVITGRHTSQRLQSFEDNYATEATLKFTIKRR